MRALSSFAALAAIALLGACSSGGSGVSTASILDGSPSSAGVATEVGSIKNDDPNARTVQVAWTAARAQKCGFVFDPAKLKANFLANEQARVPGSAANVEKVYDQTFTSLSARIKSDDAYCGPKKSAIIKADLQRHLAGNYDPHLPDPGAKKVASGGLFEGLVSDEPPQPFDQKNFWKDLEDKKSGAKF